MAKEIKYGIESIYLTLSKVIVILIISYLLGLIKEAILFLLIFNILRSFAFGLHASKSIWCWISSSISFIGIPYICKTFVFSNLIYFILPIICLVCFILYAPADTIKRPLINSKKRKILENCFCNYSNLSNNSSRVGAPINANELLIAIAGTA